ncbi:MAG: hypothetical protein ACKPKO_12345, partial [Candidatus Fonsibacter sp.]
MTFPYVNFTSPGNDLKGRIGSFIFLKNQSYRYDHGLSLKMVLYSTTLTVTGTVTQSSDQRLKFSEQPLVN